MKFFKKHRLNLIIVLVIIAAAYTVVYMKQQKLYDNNPGLIPPRSNYDVTLGLDEKAKSYFEEQVKKYDDMINFVPSTGGQEVGFENGVMGSIGTISKPEATRFYEKAMALVSLGRYTESIETYNDLFKIYENDIQGLKDLAELYSIIKQPELAILQYKKLVEVDKANALDHYGSIIDLYLEMEDPEQAGQRYVKYETNGGTRNEILMNNIKSMKTQQK